MSIPAKLFGVFGPGGRAVRPVAGTWPDGRAAFPMQASVPSGTWEPVPTDVNQDSAADGACLDDHHLSSEEEP